MALTIAIEGKGVIANCDALTDDSGGTGTGDWSEVGGGTMALSEDVFLFGGSCIGGKYAGKSGFQQFDLGVGNELDFDVAGNEEGQLIYIWIAMTALGTLDTLANFALCVRISSASPGTSDYKDYLIAGSDDKNGWTGGFKLFVIDPTKTASREDGSPDIGAIRTLGVWIDCSGSARADSIFIDQIAVGTGIRITGDSTTGWADAVAYCTDYANRAWGMLQERDGIYYSFGKTYIGDATSQSANVSFADSGRIIQYGTSQYYESAAWKSSYDIDANGIVIEDHASWTTTFTDGVIVGTEKGRSGSVIIGSPDQDVSLDLYGGNHAGSVTALYGTIFKAIRGVINSGNDSDHKFLSCSFIGCSQFNPVGAPLIRNCTFAETIDTDAALLWNENIDVTDCSFIANTLGAAIEMPSAAGTPYTYDALIFSGNIDDVLNSSGTAITIENSNGANASSSEGSAVTFITPATLSVHVEDAGGSNIEHAQVYLHKASPTMYTADTGNNAGDGDLVVNEAIDTDLPQTGWCIIWDRSANEIIPVRYGSWASQTFTFRTEVTGTANSGGSGTTLKRKTGDSFLTADIEEGDAVRNTTDGSWAIVDEIVDADTITTTQLQGPGDNTWSEDDAYSFHKLPVTLIDGDDIVDVPIMNKQTDASGDCSKGYNGSGCSIIIRVRCNETATKYVPYITSGAISGNYSLTVVLQEDEVAT